MSTQHPTPVLYRVTGRFHGPVLAVLTGESHDRLVIERAVVLARRSGRGVIAAACVDAPPPGPPHPAHVYRVSARTHTIVTPVASLLEAADVPYMRTSVLVDDPTDHSPSDLTAPVRSRAVRLNAALIISAVPLPDPTGVIRPVPPTSPQHESPAWITGDQLPALPGR